jgi:NADH-quinone oxidoreductase subunit G
MVKRADGWQEVEWEEALHIAAQALGERVKEQGADQLGMLASPSATLEELSLFGQLAEGLGVNNIDHRLRQTDFTGQAQQPLFPFLGQTIEELEQANAVLVVGGNLRKDQPILGHRIRKAAKAGASVMMINPVDYPLTYKLAHKSIVAPSHLVQSLAGVAAALLQSRKARAPEALQTVIEQTLPNDTEQAMAATLADAENATLLLGLDATLHPAFSTLRAIAVLIGELSGARVGFVSDGANSAGACLAGVLPHRSAGGVAREVCGLDAAQMIAQPRKNYLLLNIEPEFDCGNGAQALAAMQQAEFVVALTPYVTDSMRDYADVLLPAGVFAETSGTFVNVEGRWQSFAAASRAPGDTRPGWKILRVLGNLLELDGFDPVSSEQVRDSLSEQLGEVKLDNSACGDAVTPPSPTSGLERIASLPMYAVDNIGRRAGSLQLTPDGQVALLRLHPDDAASLSLADGDRATVAQDGNSVTLEVVVDARVAKGAAVAPQAIEATLALGGPSGTLQVKKA